VSALLPPADSEQAADLRKWSAKLFADRDDDRAGAHLGWFGISISEDAGGVGGTLSDLAVLVEIIGSVASPSAIPWTTGVIGRLLADHAATNQGPRILATICAGDTTVAVPCADPWRTVGEIIACDGLLQGSGLVLGAETTTLVAVPHAGAAGVGVALLRPDIPGLTLTPVPGFDPTRRMLRMELSGVALRDADVVIEGKQAVEQMSCSVALIAALDSAGLARRALERTVDFATVRHQFGRPIGSFQAYKHRCANLYISLLLSQSLAFRAARTEDGKLARAAALEGTRLCTIICGEAVQLHGAMGFSWESGLHALLKRARTNEIVGTRHDQPRVAPTRP
jgi:alkylation response protein AidB-like acyl-CoA dehydrogenase